MSIRNAPQLTPQLLDAARLNARRSRGPSTASGKHHSRMNALEHGERSAPENHYAVMLALGEDPAQFEALKQELRGSFGPGDAFFDKQVDDLARLYTRRERLERLEGGLVQRARLELEEREHRRRLAIEGAGFEPGQALNADLTQPSDPAARLRLQRSFLGLIREQVRARSFLPWQGAALEGFGKGRPGWRPARLAALLKEFAGKESRLAEEQARRERADMDAAILAAAALWVPAEPQAASAEGPAAADSVAQSPCSGEPAAAPPPAAEGVGQSPRGGDPAALPTADALEELRYRELLTLLEVEIAHVECEFEYEEQMNERRVEIEREACAAPSGAEWKLLLRREETLDRSIDRKIRLLLTLRKNVGAPAADVGASLVGAHAGDEGGHQGRPYEEPAKDVAAPANDAGPPANDVGAPLVGAPADAGDCNGCPVGDAASTAGRPSPEAAASQVPAVSSAGA